MRRPRLVNDPDRRGCDVEAFAIVLAGGRWGVLVCLESLPV